ncbi:hypothetical protein BGY98DRAFT_976153 [Russula aff. rugulosa BPL654]|nr:hypothetical protein BGY98DRAFT_976153 [Russula aff. rugulosa BPL654]
MLEAMRRENEHLRNRWEELIQHRRRLGLPVDNLIGLSAHDPYFQPTHRRSFSNTSSPSTSVVLPPMSGGPHAVRASPSVAIPRPPSQIHRPLQTPHQNRPPRYPTLHRPHRTLHTSPHLYPHTRQASQQRDHTPSSTSAPRGTASTTIAPQPLSYPSVPPPSLSSSYAGPDSPVELRGSRWRHGSLHELRQASRSASRHGSVERGARVAETGQLVPRSRAGSIVPGATSAPPPSTNSIPPAAEVGSSSSS